MQSNKSCLLVEQYLNYLAIIKYRAENTIIALIYLCFLVSNPRLTHTQLTTMILVGLY